MSIAATCARKKQFTKRAEANRVMQGMIRHYVNPKGLNVYKCLQCKSFHIGHKR